MNKKLTNILTSGKKKAGAIAACTMLALSCGATAVLAESNVDQEEQSGLMSSKTSLLTDSGKTWPVEMPEMQFEYSSDGGETWNEGLPPADSEAESIMIRGQHSDGLNGIYIEALKVDDSGIQGFADEEPVWHEAIPAGTVFDSENAAFLTTPGEAGGCLVKVEDGIVFSSTDDGETWQEGLPADSAVQLNTQDRTDV